jgi:hypothetical protein
MSASGLGCAKTSRGSTHALPFEAMRASGAERCFSGERRAYVASYALNCCHERLNANDVHDAGEIVGKDVQRHLGSDAR